MSLKNYAPKTNGPFGVMPKVHEVVPQIPGFHIVTWYDHATATITIKLHGHFKSVLTSITEEALLNAPPHAIAQMLRQEIEKHKLVPFEQSGGGIALDKSEYFTTPTSGTASGKPHPVVQSLQTLFDMQQRELRECCTPGVYTLAETVIHLNDTHRYSFEQIAAWLESSNYDIAARPQEE